MIDVFGAILQDQITSEKSVYYQIERDDGLVEQRDAKLYFTDKSQWSPMEVQILEHAVSPVIDLGCGGGRHSLYLQNKGFLVKPIDISPGAVEVCSQRGLVNCEVQSIWDLDNGSVKNGKFKTLLLMGNNLGLSGSYDVLNSLLQILESVCESGAILIGDFISPIPTHNDVHLKYHQANQRLGKPIGEMKIRIHCKNLKSTWSNFYLPTHLEFMEIIKKSNWRLKNELDFSKNHQFIILSYLNG